MVRVVVVVDVEVLVELGSLEVAFHSFEHSQAVKVGPERRNHLTFRSFCPSEVLIEYPTEDRLYILTIFSEVWSIESSLIVVNERITILEMISLLYERRLVCVGHLIDRLMIVLPEMVVESWSIYIVIHFTVTERGKQDWDGSEVQ